jgi:hypothetical protein
MSHPGLNIGLFWALALGLSGCGLVDTIRSYVRFRPQEHTIEKPAAFVIAPQFSFVGEFDASGLAPASVPDPENKDRTVWGFINTQGEMVIQPQFLSAGSFQKGYAPACQDSDYERAKCGVIDKMGKFVVPPKYDWIDLNGYQNGLLKVMLNEKWGYIR